MEETWIFFGQCIPARFPMTFDFPSEVGIRSEFGDLVCSATIFAGQAVVRVTAQNEITNIFTLRNIVEQLLRTVADAITFVLGNSVSIDIIAAVRSDQWTWHVFGTSIPALTGRGRPSLPAIALSPDFFSVIAQSPELILALASLREAMQKPGETGAYCFRAVEALLVRFKTQTGKDKEAWERLRSELRVDRQPLDWVKGFAEPQRHGRWAAMDDGDRADAMLIADQVIWRYLTYAQKGFCALSATEFPSAVLDRWPRSQMKGAEPYSDAASEPSSTGQGREAYSPQTPFSLPEAAEREAPGQSSAPASSGPKRRGLFGALLESFEAIKRLGAWLSASRSRGDKPDVLPAVKRRVFSRGT